LSASIAYYWLGAVKFQLAFLGEFKVPAMALVYGPLLGMAVALAGSIGPALTARRVEGSEGVGRGGGLLLGGRGGGAAGGCPGPTPGACRPRPAKDIEVCRMASDPDPAAAPPSRLVRVRRAAGRLFRAIVSVVGTVFTLGLSLLPLSALIVALPAVSPNEAVL